MLDGFSLLVDVVVVMCVEVESVVVMVVVVEVVLMFEGGMVVNVYSVFVECFVV